MLRISRSLTSIRFKTFKESTTYHPIRCGGFVVRRLSADDSDDSKKNAVLAALLPETTIDDPAWSKRIKTQNAAERGLHRRKGNSLLPETTIDHPSWPKIIIKAQSTSERKGNGRGEDHNNNQTKAGSFFDEVDGFLRKDDSHKVLNVPETESKPTNACHAKVLGDPPSWTSLLPDSSGGNQAEKQMSSTRSIFDVFKAPAKKPQRSANAFDAEAFVAYNDFLEAYFDDQESKAPSKKLGYKTLTLEMKRAVEDWIRLDHPKVEIQLPVLTRVCDEGIEVMVQQSTRSTLKKEVKSELQSQAKTFMEQLAWSTDQYDYAIEILLGVSKLSSQKALAVLVIWEKLKEAGSIKKNTMRACLHASTGFSGGALTRNRSTLVSLPPRNRLYDILERKEASKVDMAAAATADDAQKNLESNVPEQLAAAHDLLYEPTHQSIAIRTRRLISRLDASGALELIEACMEGEAKFRAYPQVFSLYLDLGDIDSAMLLFTKMKKKHDTVPVQPEHFVQLIAAVAEKGYFCRGSKEVGAAARLGYSPASGPSLLDQMCSEMSDFVGFISSASAKRLQKAFRLGFNGRWSTLDVADGDISALAPLKSMTEPVPEKVLIADRVSVDFSSGFCSSSGATLRLIGLEPYQSTLMKDSVVDLAEHLAGNRKNKSRQVDSLLSFWDWLDNRTGRPFTVIVDGANVAYYMQNFEDGKFNFHQIQFAVRALEDIGENPLVILPRKYQEDSFNITLGTNTKRQEASRSERLILKRLEDSETLFVVPQGCLDDYFWILASVSAQTNCQPGSTESSLFEGKRQWPGGRALVMTNDQIRDHQQFELLEPKLFNRWYSSTIVNYNFTGFVNNDCVDRDIAFTPADVFSREIQRNTPKNAIKVTSCWHFPVEESDWFCIRLPAEG